MQGPDQERQARAVGGPVIERRRLLARVECLDPFARRLQTRRDRFGHERARVLARRNRDAQRIGGEVRRIEAPRVGEQRRVTAGADGGDDLRDAHADLGRGIPTAREERRERYSVRCLDDDHRGNSRGTG